MQVGYRDEGVLAASFRIGSGIPDGVVEGTPSVKGHRIVILESKLYTALMKNIFESRVALVKEVGPAPDLVQVLLGIPGIGPVLLDLGLAIVEEDFGVTDVIPWILRI